MGCCPREPEMFEVVVIVMVMQLFSGLIATTWTAFYKDGILDAFPYVIFGVYVAFATVIFCCLAVDIYYSKQQTHQKFSLTDRCLFEICSLVTVAFLLVVIFYNTKKLGHPLWTDFGLVTALYVYGFALFFLMYNFIASTLCTSRYRSVVFDTARFSSASDTTLMHGKWI